MHPDRGRQYTSSGYAGAAGIHNHCDYVSPNDYEKDYWIKLRHLEINVA